MTVVFLAGCTTRSKCSPFTITRYQLIEVPFSLYHIWDPDFGTPQCFWYPPPNRKFGIPVQSYLENLASPCKNSLVFKSNHFCCKRAIQRMSTSYYLTARFDNCVPWRQLGSCSVTRPFLSAKGVACKTRQSQNIYFSSMVHLEIALDPHI